MPHIDLEPGDYRVKGRKEPILLPGWWIGILTFVGIILFAMFIGQPVAAWWWEFSDPFVSWLVGR